MCINEIFLMYHKGKVVYSEDVTVLARYINSWITSNRGAILIDKKVFFLSSDRKAAFLLKDKAVIEKKVKVCSILKAQN